MEAHKIKLLLNRLKALTNHHLVNPHTSLLERAKCHYIMLGQYQKECSLVGNYRSYRNKEGIQFPLRYQG